MAIKTDIKVFFKENRDENYAAFQVKLIPGINPKSVIGLRTPLLRKFAKELIKREDAEEFLSSLPHKTFDENQLHAFMISEIKDYNNCIDHVNAFLPYVDNWATCDQMSPKIFKKNKDKVLKEVKKWIASKEIYTVRFGICELMTDFLDSDYDEAYPEMIASVRSDEYYINMMIAWYFATALAKQYESVIGYIENKKLDKWTHNKTIQKAIESYRITDRQKEYLRSLKIK